MSKHTSRAGHAGDETGRAVPTVRVWVVVVVLAAAGGGLLAGVLASGVIRAAVGRWRHSPAGPTDAHRYYTCGMHPWVVLADPGNCPVCHMPLVVLDPARFTGQMAVDPLVTQSIGVRVAPVTRGPVRRIIHTVGTVDYHEPSVRDINIKVGGWVEKLYADSLGMAVRSGDRLFDIYSPQLYAAQEEYLLALRNTQRTPDASTEPGRSARDLLESARTRLKYFDISDAQIDALSQAGKPSKTLTINCPYSGLVIAKSVTEGMKVEAGTQVFRIADLSRVWVMVTLYEYQLPFVQVGQQAVVSLSYIPGQTFAGKVNYIYPYLDEKLREVKVRMEFENPGLLLKPGMFVNVELATILAEDRTLVPREAVIDTGRRQVAFVSLGQGRFEPRDVRTGALAENGMVEILDGLKPGELAVVSGQFLLDSEGRVREQLAKMVRGQLAVGQPAVADETGPAELSPLPPDAADRLARAIQSYLDIGGRLAGDSVDGVAPAARDLAGAVDGLLAVPVPGDPHFWHRHDEGAVIRGKALELASAGDLVRARAAFADLSVALAKLLRATGVPRQFGQPVQELHCPMFREGQGGAVWLQTGDEVRNPYFGRLMLGCFDSRHALPMERETTARPPASQPRGSSTAPGGP